MSAAAVLVPLALALKVEDEEGDDGDRVGVGVGVGAMENKVRSGVRSNSYEQKKRPMYGAVPSSAAASPWYAVRMRDDNVFVRLLHVTVFDVDDNAAGAGTASSPRRSDRTAARSVG